MVFVTKKRRRDKNEQKVSGMFNPVFVRVLSEHTHTNTHTKSD